MKSFNTFFLPLMLAMLAAMVPAGLRADDNKKGATIEITEKSHDFGTIAEEGGPVHTEFAFTNTGDMPLVIISATASCGCTRPDYPKNPIEPGKSGKVKVTYLPAGRPGEFNKTVTLRTNDKKHKKVTLKINGFVTPKADK